MFGAVIGHLVLYCDNVLLCVLLVLVVVCTAAVLTSTHSSVPYSAVPKSETGSDIRKYSSIVNKDGTTFVV